MARKTDNGRHDVEAYLAGVPEDVRRVLEKLRRWIRAAAPDATEGLCYGVPAFRLTGRPLVCYAAFQKHCGFYPTSPDVLKLFADELDDYETGEGTIRFTIDRPLPASLVKRIVKARVAELEESSG